MAANQARRNKSIIQQWKYPDPYVMEIVVEAGQIDIMGHTNNTVYLDWLQRVAWAHSGQLGLDWPLYKKLDSAMVARRHEMDYLAATYENDALLIGTWIIENDGRVSITREYQIFRAEDQKLVFQAQTKWVCVALTTGRVKRMPPQFLEGYRVSAKKQ